MITGWDIYWITRLDAIKGLIVGFLTITILIMIVLAVIVYICWDEFNEVRPLKRTIKIITPLIIFFGLSLAFIPSTKEYAAIWLIPKVANNEQVQKVPDQVLRLLNLKVEQWINDMTSSKEKK